MSNPKHPVENPVKRASKAAWRPQDLRFPWEWCEDYIVVDNTSPFPGRWRSATSPWVREPMEVKADKRVTVCAIKCSAQSSKTQTVLNLLNYDISEDPGPTMYVMANKEDAADFVRDRFEPIMEKCKPARDALLRRSPLSFTFSTMPLYFVGAGSPAKLQGKPIKRLYLDEVRNYPKGALSTVMKRVRAFGALSQIFIISTPKDKGDEVDLYFEQGDQRTPHFPCPHCGHIQQLRFKQLKWSENEHTKPGGVWNFDRLAETIYFECENAACKHHIRDTPSERKNICKTARFIRMNPNAPVHHVSFTWNALLPWWVSWRSIVEEFILAHISLRSGDITLLKTFINETLGESWEDQLGVVDDFGFLEARKGMYDFGDVWAEEQRRFMSADKQEKGGEHYWWVVRAFGFGGNSRLIAYGRCNTKAELEDVRKRYEVHPINCVIDSGFSAQEVYRFCLATGWKAFKGDQFEYYLEQQRIGGRIKTIRQIWRKTVAAVYNRVTKARVAAIPLFTFCNDPSNDALQEYMQGLVGDWTLPKTIGHDYFKQVTSERREQKTDQRGKVTHFWKQVRADNHLRDCERMILVAAIISKTIYRKGDSQRPDNT